MVVLDSAHDRIRHDGVGALDVCDQVVVDQRERALVTIITIPVALVGRVDFEMVRSQDVVPSIQDAAQPRRQGKAPSVGSGLAGVIGQLATVTIHQRRVYNVQQILGAVQHLDRRVLAHVLERRKRTVGKTVSAPSAPSTSLVSSSTPASEHTGTRAVRAPAAAADSAPHARGG